MTDDTPALPPPEEQERRTLEPGLHLVATPIGNLRDVTHRALDVLTQATCIACEDTRHTVRLLQHYQIRNHLISLNEHNEARRIPELLAKMADGAAIALVSDAGTPTVSDPGQRLAQAAVAAGVKLHPVPGPSAVLTALSGSGLPVTPFYFGGFLHHKKGARTTELSAAIQRDCTSVYFESPYRILSTLEILTELAPEHKVVVGRELTKRFEEFQRGAARFLLKHYTDKPAKGEITLLIAPHQLPKWITW